MLLAECAARGWIARRAAPVPDDPGAVAELFAAAGAAEDFLVTTGGVSAGDRDLLPAAAAAAGFEILFHGLAIRPGKPTAFARRGDTFWLGLPGNPVAASVAFHLIGREALGRFEGDLRASAPRIRARLVGALPAAGDRDRFFDAVWSSTGTESRVAPLRPSGSHDLASYAKANALVHCPAGSPAQAAGDEVWAILLGDVSRPERDPATE
jgi:molybdopterin molybdotransferase